MQLMITNSDMVMLYIDSFEVYCGKKQHARDAHKAAGLQQWFETYSRYAVRTLGNRGCG